jgi:pyrimidine deaminase RibD-like protein
MKKLTYLIKEQKEYFIDLAIEIAKQSVEKGGGPFGCVIVKDGKIVNPIEKETLVSAIKEIQTIHSRDGREVQNRAVKRSISYYGKQESWVSEVYV